MIGRFFKPRLVATRSFSSGTALDYLRVRSGSNDEAIARQWTRAGFHVTNHPHIQGRHQVIVGAVTLDLLPRDDSDDTDYRSGLVDRLKFQNLPSNAQTINNSIMVSRSSRNRNMNFESSKHPNGIIRVDHIVIKTSELDNVEHSISNELQMPLRRRGEMKGKRMLWYRNAMLPDTPIIEVVECEPTQKSGKSCSTFVWGISFVTNVLEIMRDTIGHEHVSEIRPAKQPGRNICTLKNNFELGIKVAVMTPHSTARSSE